MPVCFDGVHEFFPVLVIDEDIEVPEDRPMISSLEYPEIFINDSLTSRNRPSRIELMAMVIGLSVKVLANFSSEIRRASSFFLCSVMSIK